MHWQLWLGVYLVVAVAVNVLVTRWFLREDRPRRSAIPSVAAPPPRNQARRDVSARLTRRLEERGHQTRQATSGAATSTPAFLRPSREHRAEVGVTPQDAI